MKEVFLLVILGFAFSTLNAQTTNRISMEDWNYPYEVHKIILSDSLQIAYVDEGESETTLLFVHGLGSNLKAWQNNIAVLKNNYRCIALDLPGYGRSDSGSYPFDMTFFATTIRDFVDSLKLEQVILIGHSMGGQIALHTVLNNQVAIKKLILIAPAGFETFTPKEKDWFKMVFTPAVIKATSEEQIRQNFKSNFYQMPEDAQFMIEDRLLLRQTEAYDDYCQMIPKCVIGMLNEPVFNQLSTIKMPTLVIFGANDALIPNQFLHPALSTMEVATKGQASIPGSDLKMIPDSGHFVQWEQAVQVNTEILKFCKD